jgi:hypothetical protein
LDSFGRIGTYQRVTTNPNKKIFSLCHTGPEKTQRDARACASATGLDPAIGQIYSMDSDLRKDISRTSVSLLGAEFPVAALGHVIVMRFPHFFCTAALIFAVHQFTYAASGEGAVHRARLELRP